MSEIAESDPFDRATFAEPALAFIALLRAHIGKEDHILYPMAQQMMRETDMHALDAACAQANEKNFDPDMASGWEQWARELAQRVGRDQERYDVSPACH